jgi:outer membrane protein TolC
MALGGTGCCRQCFLPECDYRDYVQGIQLPPKLECENILPIPRHTPPPATVAAPERPPRYLTLAEAIAIALEQGNIGNENLQIFQVGLRDILNQNLITDNLVQFTGRTVVGDDAVRVLALDPAILAADIEASLSKFDARWTSSMSWNTTDQPTGTALTNIQAGALVASFNSNEANFRQALIKPLPTGGVSGITFDLSYQETNSRFQTVNPAYQPTLTFLFEQPLLRGFGVEINQLRATHPGSLLNQFDTGGRVEGILIARLRFDQQRADFERSIQFMLVNVEIAYWSLYAAYWNLYSREQALRQAYEAWKINKARFDAGRINIADLAQSRQQYELFRSQRITALAIVLGNERQLRGLLGMPVEDGTRLVPADSPTVAMYYPDWETSLNEALALRPELVLARQDLKFRQLDLINAKNQVLPDLRFFSTYGITGLGDRLDGPDANLFDNEGNAFRSLTNNRFHNWTLGLRMEVPLGFRDAYAQLRQARLNLARSYAVLCDQERKVESFLAANYRGLYEFHQQIQALRSLREAAAQQLEARFKGFLAGRETIDFLLEAQRNWADALRDEYNAIGSYNATLAVFHAAKGTLLRYNNVMISEGPLPHCAQVRAVEHLRERSKALVARERAVPVGPCCTEPGRESPGLPQLPADEAPPIPALFPDGKLGVPDEPLPMPRPAPKEPEPAAAEAPAQAP